MAVSIWTGVGLPGAVGLKVTWTPPPPTAVHWLADGHAMPLRKPPGLTVVGTGLPGAVGSKVTCWPT